MPCRFCQALHAADNAWAPPALKQHGMSLLRWHESLLSSLVASFLSEKNCPSRPPAFSSQGPVRKMQRGRGSQHSKMSKVAPAVPPCTSLTESFYPFSSPARTSIPLRLRAIWSHSVEAMMVIWMTACHWRLQMWSSGRGRTTTPPPCILRIPAHPAQAWTPIFSASSLTL